MRHFRFLLTWFTSFFRSVHTWELRTRINSVKQNKSKSSNGFSRFIDRINVNAVNKSCLLLVQKKFLPDDIILKHRLELSNVLVVLICECDSIWESFIKIVFRIFIFVSSLSYWILSQLTCKTLCASVETEKFLQVRFSVEISYLYE